MLNLAKVYEGKNVIYSGRDIKTILKHLKNQNLTVWIDYKNATESDYGQITKTLDLHPLAVEDALKSLQRPKIDQYKTHTFMTIHRVKVKQKITSRGYLDFIELDIFFGKNFVITSHQASDDFLNNLSKKWDKVVQTRGVSVGYLVYSISDAVVDDYFKVVDAFEDIIDSIEVQVFGKSGDKALKDIFYTKKELLYFRKVVTPLREVIASMSKYDQSTLGEEFSGYFSDVYDHVIRVSEAIDIYRDLLTNTIESHLSIVSNRLNEVMKELTSWAAILIVNGTIAGIYGMNFIKPWPDYQDPYGFYIAIGMMAAATIFLLYYFKKRDWL